MNILVTGGAGYIGTHTLVELLDRGHDVVAVSYTHLISLLEDDLPEPESGLRLRQPVEGLLSARNQAADDLYRGGYRRDPEQCAQRPHLPGGWRLSV